MPRWTTLAWWREQDDRLRAWAARARVPRASAATAAAARRALAGAWGALAFASALLLAWILVALAGDLPRPPARVFSAMYGDATFLQRALAPELFFGLFGFGAFVAHPLALAVVAGLLAVGLARGRGWAVLLTLGFLVLVAAGSVLYALGVDASLAARFPRDLSAAARAANLLVAVAAGAAAWALRPAASPMRAAAGS